MNENKPEDVYISVKIPRKEYREFFRLSATLGERPQEVVLKAMRYFTLQYQAGQIQDLLELYEKWMSVKGIEVHDE